MSQVNFNSQVHFDNTKYADFEAKYCNVLKNEEGQWNEHKVVSGLPDENQTSVTVTDNPGGITGFLNKIGRFFRRVFGLGLAQADQDLKSISADFRRSVADIFGGEGNIPDSVRRALDTHDRADGKMRPLSSHRIKIVNAALFALKPAASNEVLANPEVVPANNENVGEQQQIEQQEGEQQGGEVNQQAEKKENEVKVEENKEEIENEVKEPEEDLEVKRQAEVTKHNDAALKQLADFEKDVLDGLKDIKAQQLSDVQNEIKGLKLNDSAEEAAIKRMTKVINERFNDLQNLVEQEVGSLKQKIAGATKNVEKFEEEITLAGDLDKLQKGCLEEIENKKDGLFTLIKGFQDGTSDTFKTLAKEYFNSNELANLLTNVFKDKGYSPDQLFAANKDLFDTLKDGILTGISEGDDGKAFLKDAENWLAEVIDGKTSGFDFAAPKGDKMEASGKKIADKVLHGFQQRENKFEKSLADAMKWLITVNRQIKDDCESDMTNLDIGKSWFDQEDQQSIQNAFKKNYSEASNELADYAKGVDLVSVEDIKKGMISLDEAKNKIEERATFVANGLKNLKKSKQTVELGLRNFVSDMDSYVQMLPEENRNVFKRVISGKIVNYLNGAFSSNAQKEHSIYDKKDEVFERLTGLANPALREKGLPELSTVRMQYLPKIVKVRKGVEEITSLIGSTPEKLKAWTGDNTLHNLTAAFNASLNKAFVKVTGGPCNDGADMTALNGVLVRASKVIQALKKVSVMIDLYCGSVKNEKFQHEAMNLGDKNRIRLTAALASAIENIIVDKTDSGVDLSEEDILRVFGEKIRDDVAPHVTLQMKVQQFDLDGILNAI